MPSDRSRRTAARRDWLFLITGDDRQHRGNALYDDDPERRYSFDSTVSRSRAVRAGDRVVIWDGARLLGAARIERLVQQPGLKLRNRCPTCRQTTLKQRKTITPVFRCDRCHSEFDHPLEEYVDVEDFVAEYGSTWIPLTGLLTASEVRALSDQPKSQHSIRPVAWEAFVQALRTRRHLAAATQVERLRSVIPRRSDGSHSAGAEPPQS